MFKKTITYTDYNGVEQTEDFYFNLNKAELMEMEVSTEGGFAEKIKKVIESKNAKEVISIFKEIIAKSYGEKSADGKRFVKNPEITQGFLQSEAYSNLFMELASDADAAAAFVNGIVPAMTAEQKAEAEKLLNKK